MRLRDWDRRLTAWAAGRLQAPFRWGQTDCTLLVLEAFDALTGRDVAAGYRGAWANARQAVRYARHTSLVWFLEAQGCRRVDAGFRQRGDFLLRPGRVFVEGHVCLGERVLSSWVAQGVGMGNTRDLVALPGLVVLRAG